MREAGGGRREAFRSRAVSTHAPRGSALALAVVGAGLSASAASAVTSGGSSPSPPLTFDEAKAAGTNVDWGPNCDTTTGRVTVLSNARTG